MLFVSKKVPVLSRTDTRSPGVAVDHPGESLETWAERGWGLHPDGGSGVEGSGQIGEPSGGLSGETWQQADHVGSGREEQQGQLLVSELHIGVPYHQGD